MSRYSDYYEIFPKEGNSDYEILIDATLLLISGVWLGTFGVVSFALLKTLSSSNKKLLDKINNNKEKEVVIVRGVPGCGKDKYVYYNELDKKNNFTVCSSDKFFYKNGRYHFNRTKLNQSDAYCLQQFHQSLKLQVPRVYVTNVNQEKWMYANYVKLAESYKYKVKVVTIVCEDEDHVRYFNSRSRHNVPMNFSRKVFEDWETDNNEELIDAYIGDENGYLEGDSLPFPVKTAQQLDEELDNYHTNDSCLVDSENEGQITRDTDDESCEEELESECNDLENTNIIEIITQEDVNKIDYRNINLQHDNDDHLLNIVRADNSEEQGLNLAGLSGYLI